jgi:predicted deacylase
MAAIEIGGLVAKSGDTVYGFLKIGELADGTAVQIPVSIINGNKPGPRMFIVSGIHAHETEGVETVRRLLKAVSPEILHGTLVAVPVANVLGFQWSPPTRYSPLWVSYDASDIDNSFPGNPEGTATERAAAAIANYIIKGSDYGIDFHCGRFVIRNLPHVRTYAAQECANQGELALLMEAFGTEIILSIPSRYNNIQYWASRQGIPTIMVEAGGGLEVSEEIVKGGLQGVLNIMAKVGMLKQEVRPSVHKVNLVDAYSIPAPCGGFFRPCVTFGERVRTGQVVGEMSDVFGRTRMQIVTPRAGFVFGMRIAPTSFEGALLMNIGIEDG